MINVYRKELTRVRDTFFSFLRDYLSAELRGERPVFFFLYIYIFERTRMTRVLFRRSRQVHVTSVLDSAVI